jgi:hypothetical protein
MKTGGKISASTAAGLLFFGLSSGLVLAILPRSFTSTADKPPFGLFALASTIVITLTGLLFVYFGRLRLGFRGRALALAFGYSAVIAVLKLTISPTALYHQFTFDDSLGNPNGVMYQVFVAVALLLTYALVFWIIYRFSRRRSAKILQLPKAQRHHARRVVSTVLLFGILAVVLTGGAALYMALFGILVPLSYVSAVAANLAIPMLAAIVAGVVLATTAFREVEEEAIRTKNVALLSSFLWLGLALIFVFHILWLIFILTLINIWPFRTYSPK